MLPGLEDDLLRDRLLMTGADPATLLSDEIALRMPLRS